MAGAKQELPLGFSMSLAMRREALDAFSRLPQGERDRLVEESRHVKTKDEMERLVDSLLRKG